MRKRECCARGEDSIMKGHGSHCPFLNRSDPQCAEYLRLGSLVHAFEHCWGEYRSCPVYADLMMQRRARRRSAAQPVPDEPANAVIQVTVTRRAAEPQPVTA